MTSEKLKNAHEYAWQWFAYHATQRMNSFNFFFVLEAALTAAYLAAVSASYYLLAVAFAVMLFVTAMMFWRLDLRNLELIKIGEAYLKKSEAEMAEYVGKEIRILTIAENRDSEFAPKWFPKLLSSYRQIFQAIFCAVATFACFAIIYAIWLSWTKALGGN